MLEESVLWHMLLQKDVEKCRKTVVVITPLCSRLWQFAACLAVFNALYVVNSALARGESGLGIVKTRFEVVLSQLFESSRNSKLQ